MKRVLVAYATKKGSTREVAEAIAAALIEEGCDAELRPAAEIEHVNVYDGVVLGGSLYMGRWHRDARGFLRRHRGALTTVPLAVFGMGPLTLADKDVAGARKQLDHALSKVPEVEPASVAIFGGVVAPETLSFPFNHMPASDERNWDTIRSWSREFAESLESETLARATS